jgi:hypothetical protein
MENVLAAFVTIFLVLFSVLTFSSAVVKSQDSLSVSWQAMQARADDRARTSLSPFGSQAINTTAVLEFAFRNDGKTRLADFDRWDLIVHYADNADPATYHTAWLPYVENSPADNQWTVEGIYQNARKRTPEEIEPGIVNPGEELIVRVKLASPTGIGKTIQVALSTANGSTATVLFTPDAPPVLATNTGVMVEKGHSVTIQNRQLSVTDEDDQPGDLVYAITTPPAQGSLGAGSTFTQMAVDSDALRYTHTGDGKDSFQFIVSDGKTATGPFTVTIRTVVMTNIELAVPSGESITIDKAHLAALDPDDSGVNLRFTIVTGPTHGSLSLGSSFTQKDIESGSLTYTRETDGDDSFTFNLSDGTTTLGPYTFSITQP